MGKFPDWRKLGKKNKSVLCHFIFTYIVGKVASGVLRDWMIRKHEEYGQSIYDKWQAQDFYKDPLVEKLKDFSTWAETGYPEWLSY